MKVFQCIGVVSALVVTTGALAESVSLTSDRDNTMYVNVFDLSNGSGDHFFSGNNGSGDPRRALIRFDVADAVPAGATIESVQLTLFMSRTFGGEFVSSIYRLTNDWGESTSDAPGNEGQGDLAEEGDATWDHTFFSATTPEFWDTDGGDFAATASAVIQINDIAYYTWGSTNEMVADVQAWLDAPEDNFGWIIIGDEGGFGTTKRFDSRENPDPMVRPQLLIEYSLSNPADLNGDGFVNGADLAELLANWGPCPGCAADLNGDGDVNGADLADLLANWT